MTDEQTRQVRRIVVETPAHVDTDALHSKIAGLAFDWEHTEHPARSWDIIVYADIQEIPNDHR